MKKTSTYPCKNLCHIKHYSHSSTGLVKSFGNLIMCFCQKNYDPMRRPKTKMKVSKKSTKWSKSILFKSFSDILLTAEKLTDGGFSTKTTLLYFEHRVFQRWDFLKIWEKLFKHIMWRSIRMKVNHHWNIIKIRCLRRINGRYNIINHVGS